MKRTGIVLLVAGVANLVHAVAIAFDIGGAGVNVMAHTAFSVFLLYCAVAAIREGPRGYIAVSWLCLVVAILLSIAPFNIALHMSKPEAYEIVLLFLSYGIGVFLVWLTWKAWWRPLYIRTLKTEPNKPPQRNSGSRPSSNDSPASETPSSLGPRG